ncbi:hypothetical protein J2W57_000054 [Chryseobacterium ginsenosidimutans]|uniref:Uncharacterized protein n=1 Tax=Chryseobacterium geocarposphaerae TaxID=1416776 RepID=A0ABU1L8W6_9FLAO|nr:hypothetical protein [Chryseobacterium geocarposphaerae]MDR6696705.1 hypothetical protein [Chryseobacterium ginsenosidimutans]
MLQKLFFNESKGKLLLHMAVRGWVIVQGTYKMFGACARIASLIIAFFYNN